MLEYRYRLAICVPTANRAKQVLLSLKKLKNNLEELGVGLYILDGSEEAINYEKVHEHVKQQRNMHYKFFGSGPELNQKRYFARWREPDSEYIWCCSDKRIPTSKTLSDVLNLIKYNPKCIILNTLDVSCSKTRRYLNVESFFRDCCWHTQMMGANIVKKELMCSLWNLEETIRQIEFESAHIEMRQIFTGLSIEDESCFLYTQYYRNAYLPDVTKFISGTLKKDTMFLSFIDKAIIAVESLPSRYSKHKDYVIKSMSTKTYWFCTDGFCELRYLGVLNTRQCIQYYNKIKRVSYVHPVVVIVISLLPKEVAAAIRDYVRNTRAKQNIKRSKREV